MESIRCQRCNKLLAKAEDYSAIEIKCPRCGTFNTWRATPSPLPERPGASPTKDRFFGTPEASPPAHPGHHPPPDF